MNCQPVGDDKNFKVQKKQLQPILEARAQLNKAEVVKKIESCLKTVLGDAAKSWKVEVTTSEDREGNETTVFEIAGFCIYQTPVVKDLLMLGGLSRKKKQKELVDGWAIDTTVSSGGTYWQPPDYDVKELGHGLQLVDVLRVAINTIIDDRLQGWYEDSLSEDLE